MTLQATVLQLHRRSGYGTLPVHKSGPRAVTRAHAAAAPWSKSTLQPTIRPWQQATGQLHLWKVQARPKRHSSFGEGPPLERARSLARMITDRITSATSIQDLEDVVDEWGGTFDFQHAAAAFTKAAKLAQRAPKQAWPLLRQLDKIWGTLMQDSGPRGLANVLWACGKLGYRQNPALWSKSLAAFMQLLQHPKPDEELVLLCVVNVAHALGTISASKGNVPGVPNAELQFAMQHIVRRACVYVTNPNIPLEPQHVANLLWACARLRFLPDDATMQHLLQALARSDVLGTTSPQHIYNALYAMGELQQHCGWQPQIKQQVWQRLMQRSKEMLQQQNDIRLAATMGWAVTQLNLPELAADTKALVAVAVHGSAKLNNKDATMLLVFHSWLIKQQLLDGQGLAAVLTQQQLEQAKAAS